VIHEGGERGEDGGGQIDERMGQAPSPLTDLASGELLELGEALARLDAVNPMRIAGRVKEVTGLVLRAAVPGIRVGELVRIEGPGGRVDAEVVGFRDDEVVLMPLGEVRGIGPDALVSPLGRPFSIRVGEGLFGRVLDGLGVPMDDGPPLAEGFADWAVDRAAPAPLRRTRIVRPLALGVRALDAFTTVGEGQRVGVFAGAGVGKSTLLGQVARASEADVNVIALVGERGREVRDFLETALGPEGRKRSVVVAATSDMPSLVRLKAAFVATAIAEWFRDRGARVLLMMDSLTRFARAQREVGLAAGEPPVRQGFPPSVFALLPRLLERAGTSEHGSITGLYTVLVGGGDFDDPVAEEARATLDGHIVLSRALADRGHFPAVDVLPSLSRLMSSLVDAHHRTAATRVRAWLAAYERNRDLISLGAYQDGSDVLTDTALARLPDIQAFLCQGLDDLSPLSETRRKLLALAAR